MKDFFEKFNEFKEKKNSNAILFFGFYFLFFVFVFLVIHSLGDKNGLLQEYEKGNTKGVFESGSAMQNNFYYDYKVLLDGVVYDYYGKKLNEEESFKYNNQDYYLNQGKYYLLSDSLEPCENPVLFRDFMELNMIDQIMNMATYVSKTEYDDGAEEYRYMISTNTLNSILHQEDTDYDDIPDDITIKINSNKEVQSIVFNLNQYCKYQESCNNSLRIELSYELFGQVSQIKKE